MAKPGRKGCGIFLSIHMGYTGIYRQPYPNQTTYGDTIFAVTDDTHQELNLIMLTPGAYKDAYQIAAKATYQYINIFVPAVDINFISDLFRLYMDLLKIKMHVKWYFPDVMEDLTKYVLFDLGHISGKYFSSPNIPGLTIDFVRTYDEVEGQIKNSALSGRLDHNLYDICVCDGSKYVMLAQYMDANKLQALVRTGNYDEIHLSYLATPYEGLNYKECVKLNPKYKTILFANGFACREEFLDCTEQMGGRPGYRIYHDVY